MCELFAICAKQKTPANEYLRKFFAHGNEHPNGWGFATFDGDDVHLEKEPENSANSRYLSNRLRAPITESVLLAHIRYATAEAKYRSAQQSRLQAEKRLREAKESLAACTIIATTPGVVLYDDPSRVQYPMPVMSEDRDEVFVGRVRRDLSQPKTLNLWVVADNLRKGAATNAIQIMEALLNRGL